MKGESFESQVKALVSGGLICDRMYGQEMYNVQLVYSVLRK